MKLNVLLLSLLSGAVSPTHAAAAEFKPGDPFPTITLPRVDDGQATSMGQFRGQRVMLHIFASW